MKRPSEADFELQLLEGGVNVLFKPTKSHYSFVRLADEHVSRFGQLSRDARIRHAATGNIAEYSSSEVLEMAYKLACRLAAASGRR